MSLVSRHGLAVAALLCPMWAQAQSIDFAGSCPSSLDVQVTGITPGGQYAILNAADAGASGVVPAGPCAGVATGLRANTQNLVRLQSDNGSGTWSRTGLSVNPFICGRAFAVVDVDTCSVSDVTFAPDADPRTGARAGDRRPAVGSGARPRGVVAVAAISEPTARAVPAATTSRVATLFASCCSPERARRER